MGSTQIPRELEAELAQIAEQEGCELLHVGFRGGVLQLVLDHPEGVNHAHCEAVSKRASALLDIEDFGGQHYVLEVSSPGLDRQLYRPADYRRFEGKKARVTYTDPEGRKVSVVGRLAGYAEAPARITVIEELGKQTAEREIPLDAIQGARLVLDF